MTTRIWALGALVLVALASAGAARPTTPGANGLIVYAEEVEGRSQLFTIRPDGSRRTRITNVLGAWNPDWAPNGRSIVFELESRDSAGIALTSPTGGNVRELTPRGFQGQPSFSPDGRWIVYEREAGGNGIWLMRANGTEKRRLTRNPFAGGECGCDTDPNFSPDGRLISFVRVKKDAELQALFVVRRDGTGLRRVTPYTWEIAIKHDWSPDGRTILLTTNADLVRPGASANLVTIRPDGSGQTRLTHFTGSKRNAFAGSFSPDGTHIVFRLEDGTDSSIAVVDRNGGNLRRLTTGPSKPRFIDWGTHR
jgi:Tol biopolymer transport system component